MPGGILAVFFVFALVFTAAYAIGLFYHWLRFGWMYPWVYVALPIYAAGTLLLLVTMLGAMTVS